jgi:protein arginine kinase activator
MMLCQICKVNEATVRYTEIISGGLTEIHLCQKCVQSEDKTIGADFGFAGLCAAAQPKVEAPSVAESDASQKCTCCGISFGDVMSKGRLGCAECYTTFKEQLAPLIEKVHGATQHMGKIPSEKDGLHQIRSKLMRCRGKLRKAIELENYEEAAQLRDLIREIEKKMVEG